MDLIEEIHRRLPDTHLVMHGSSSVPPELVEQINRYGGTLKPAWGVPGEGDPARDPARRPQDQRRHRLPARRHRRDPQGVLRVAREVRSARLPQARARRHAGADRRRGCGTSARPAMPGTTSRSRSRRCARATRPPSRRRRWTTEPTTRACSGSSRTRPASRARTSRSAGCLRPPSRLSSAPRSSSTAKRRCAARARSLRSAVAAGTSPSGRRPSPTSPSCGCCARRESEPMSRRPASWRSPAPPGSEATRSSCTATTRTKRCCATRPGEGATVVLDAPDEAALAAAAGVRSVLVRVTLGVDADTHEAIRTGHHGSKFGLPPVQARTLIEDALGRGLDVLGLHVHVGSQLADFDAQAETIVRLASFAASCRDALGWTARVADLGGGFGIRHNLDERAPDAVVLAESAVETARTAFAEAGLPSPEVWLEPGRSLVGHGGRDAVPGRRGQAAAGAQLGRRRRRDVGQSASPALRRRLHGALGRPGRRARARSASASPGCTANRATC